MNLQRTPLFDILAGSWALERNLGCLGRALMNDEYFRRCIFNIDHAQTTRCRPGCLFSASSSFARYLSLYSKKFKLGLLFFFVANLSIPHEHRKAWLKTFFAFPSNKIFHRSMRFSFEPNKCHPCLVIHSAFLFLTVIRILTIPRIVCLYDLFFPFFTREMYRFAEEKEKKKLEYCVHHRRKKSFTLIF